MQCATLVKQLSQLVSDLQHLVAAADAANRSIVYMDDRGKVLAMSGPLRVALGYGSETEFDCTALSFRDIDAQATLLSWRSLTKILRTTEEHTFRTQLLTEELRLREGEITASAEEVAGNRLYKFCAVLDDAAVGVGGNAAHEEPNTGEPGQSASVSVPEPAPPAPDRAPLGLLWLTQFGVVRYADDAYLELTGYGREDLLDIEVDRLFQLYDLSQNWPDTLAALSESRQTVGVPHVGYLNADGRRNPVAIELEYKMRTAARRSEYIEMRLYESINETTSTAYQNEYAHESGESTDERLLLSEILYRYTIQNSSVGVYWIREDNHQFLYFNDAFQRMTGYDREELLEMRREEVFPRLTPERRAALWEALRLRKTVNVRAPIRHKSGELITVQVSATLGVYRGKLLATIMVLDLTEQIALENRAQLGQFTLDASSFGVMWVRQSDWKIIFSNRSLRRMIDFPEADADQLCLEDFMQPEDRERLPLLAKKLAKERHLQVEGHYRRSDGSLFPVRRNADLIEQGDESIVALYVEDITRERQMQHRDQLIRTATDRATLGVCVVRESDNGVVYANKAFGDLLGYELDEVMRLSAEQYLLSPGPDQWETTWKILHDTGRLDTEAVYKHRDGTPFPVYLRATYFEFESDKVTVVYVEDRRALDAAQRQLGLNQAAADDATLGIYYVQEAGNEIVYANTKIAELLGYDRETFLTLTPHAFLIDPAPEHWDDAWQSLRQFQQVDFEGTYRHRDGSVIPVKLHATYLEHDGRNLVSIYVEDQRDLHAIQEQLNLNQAVVEQSRLGIYYVSAADYSLYFANERIAEMLGYTFGEFIQLNLLDFLIMEDIDTLRAAFKHIEDHGYIVVDREYRHRDGTAIPVRLNINKIVFEGKQLAAVFVEDRREVQAAQSQLRLQQRAVDQSQVGISFSRIDTYEIIYANEALAGLLGYSIEEIKTLPPTALIAEPDEQAWLALQERLREEIQIQFEASYRHKEGYLIPSILHCNLIVENGVPIVASYVTDLRPLHQAQQRLRIHEKAVEQANVGIFSANLADLSRFDSVNEAMATNLGYTKDELARTPTVEVVVDPPPAEWPAYMDRFRQEITASVPLKLQRKSGEVRSGVAQVNYFKVDAEEFISVVIEDHTEADAREAALNEALDENILLRDRLQSENTLLREEIDQHFNLKNIITQSKAYKRVLKQVEKVADTDSTVLVTGETGTGKELIANALHQYSKRGERVMTKVNCAALPESLIESELFGHERGAFTGADARKIGRFELADGGTLFLDEVGEMPLELQPKLLRVLQEGEFERVGSTTTLKVDVRVVAATNRDLKAMVRAGTFREDLYYRLHVFPINNLPLRDRAEDIPLLVQFFVDRYARRMGRDVEEISQDSIDRLMQHPFPGNVRELENLVERSLVLHQSGPLRVLLPD